MAEIHLIPKPVKMHAMPGEFIFSAACRVAAKGEAAGIARRWVESLLPSFNFNLDDYFNEETEPGMLHFKLDPRSVTAGQ